MGVWSPIPNPLYRDLVPLPWAGNVPGSLSPWLLCCLGDPAHPSLRHSPSGSILNLGSCIADDEEASGHWMLLGNSHPGAQGKMYFPRRARIWVTCHIPALSHVS